MSKWRSEFKLVLEFSLGTVAKEFTGLMRQKYGFQKVQSTKDIHVKLGGPRTKMIT